MRRLAVPLYVIAGMLVGVILLAAYTVHENHQRDAQIEAARVERIEQLNRINFDFCLKIQKLYKARRDEAIENYRHLDRNGRLLGIRVSPELRRTARQARDETLRRFKKQKCPKVVLKIREVK